MCDMNDSGAEIATITDKLIEAAAYASREGFNFSTISLTQGQSKLLIKALAALRSEAGAAMREPQARVGRRVPRNVYWRGQPLFLAASEALAAEIVAALNAAPRSLPLQPEGEEA